MVNFATAENRGMKQIVNIIILVLVLTACKEVFDPPPKAFLNASLKYSDTKKEGLNLKIVVSAYGIGMDSIWIDQDTTRTILLPFSDTDTTNYVFVLNGMHDTVTFISDSKFIYESMESGFYPEYKIKKINSTFHRIDSLVVKDSAVTKNWDENILIYINSLPTSVN